MSALKKYKEKARELKEENEQLKEERDLWERRASVLLSYMRVPIGDVSSLDRWAAILQDIWPDAFKG